MPNLDVSPGTLRDAGANLSDGGEQMQHSNAQVLGGVDGHTEISTGGFPMGVRAQMALGSRAVAAFGQSQVITSDFRALSSALHILADVYETADHEEAIKFAFVDPSADVPRGLPGYVDPEETAGGAAPAGGAVVASDSRSATSVIAGPPDRATSSDVVTAYHDRDGGVTSASHHLTHPDGSHDYYTEVHPTDPEDAGDPIITNKLTVEPQNPAAADREYFERLEADTEAQKDERVQELLEHGHPDQRDLAGDGTPLRRPGSAAPAP
jgi:hypothetical protein